MTLFENDDWACHCCYMCKDTEQQRIIEILDFYRQKPDMNWEVVMQQVRENMKIGIQENLQ